MSERHPESNAGQSDYARAEDLAERRGCVPENDCWAECVDAALHEVEAVSGEVAR